MEDIYIAEEDRNDLEQERFALAIERIREIPDEKIGRISRAAGLYLKTSLRNWGN